jgi:hypothetical protein
MRRIIIDVASEARPLLIEVGRRLTRRVLRRKKLGHAGGERFERHRDPAQERYDLLVFHVSAFHVMSAPASR